MNNLAMISRISKEKLNLIIGKFNSVFNVVEEANDNSSSPVTYFSFDNNTSVGSFEIILNGKVNISLNKSAIKQFLVYHFIPSNKSGVKKSISYKEIAKLCNLTVPTVKANQKLLSLLGLAYSSPVGFGKIDLVIVDENKNHISKKEGGKGYITMSIETLNHLISFNSVNELKTEIKKILWIDASNGAKGKNIRFNKKNLTSMLPSYIKKSPKLIDTLLNSKKTLFSLFRASLDTSNYESKTELSNRIINIVKEKLEFLYELRGVAYSESHSRRLLEIKNNDSSYLLYKKEFISVMEAEKHFIIEDLCKLAIQYGMDKLLYAVQYMFDNHCYEANGHPNCEIVNPGAFVRTIIRQLIDEQGSLA